jgi:L-lactate dehydrogenase complex protein LldE
VFFPDAGVDAVRLLRSLGVEVDFPPGQTCCGQPAFNAGHMDLARAMAARNDAVFGASRDVVLPSGSCTAMVRRFTPALLARHSAGHGVAASTTVPSAGESSGGVRAPTAHPPSADGSPAPAADPRGGGSATLPTRFWELSEFIVRALGVSKLGDGLGGLRVAYHHGCHALRELALGEEALLLLAEAGAELVPWEAARECCGFGGLFSVKFPEVSVAMADRKLGTLPEADVLTSADAGCLLQLRGRMEHSGVGGMPVTPLASLLWRARAGGEPAREAPTGAAAHPGKDVRGAD